MKKSWFVIPLIMGAVLLAVAARGVPGKAATHNSGTADAGASNSNPANHAVTIDNFSFSPMAVTVPVGTTVVWTNHDDIPHTVVEKNQKFKSKGLDTDDSFSQTFNEPGTYEYFCSIHPKMVGKITIEAKK